MDKLKLNRVDIPPNGMHFLLSAEIMDTEAVLVMDTGASESVLDLKFAESLSIDILPSDEEAISAAVGSSNITTYIGLVHEFKLGNSILTDIKVQLMDLSNVRNSYKQMFNKDVQGLLGGDLLSQMNAIINYKEDSLQFDLPLNDDLVV